MSWLKHLVLPLSYAAFVFPNLLHIYDQFPDIKQFSYFAFACFWIGILLSARVSFCINKGFTDGFSLSKDSLIKLSILAYLISFVALYLVQNEATYAILLTTNQSLFSGLCIGLVSGVTIYHFEKALKAV